MKEGSNLYYVLYVFFNHKCWLVHIYIYMRTHVRKHGSCANFHVTWCIEGHVCAIIPGGK